jgi:hypothetical protein
MAASVIVITVENKETIGSDGLKTDLFKVLSIYLTLHILFTLLCQSL